MATAIKNPSTKPAAKTTSTPTFELPKLNNARLDVVISGDAPLIVHAWSDKAKKEMLDKQTQAAKMKKGAKDPHQDFLQSLYTIAGEEGAYGFPSVGIKASMVTGCTAIGNITKVAARQAFRVVGEQALVEPGPGTGGVPGAAGVEEHRGAVV